MLWVMQETQHLKSNVVYIMETQKFSRLKQKIFLVTER